MSAAWKPIHAFFTKHEKLLRAGISSTSGEAAALAEAVLASGLRKDPPTPDVALEAARLALVGPWLDGGSKLEEALAFVASFGPAFALDAVVTSLAMERRTPGEWNTSALWVERLARPKAVDDLEPWLRLRAHAAKASPEEREALRAVAVAKAKGAPAALRAMLAFVAPEEPTLWTQKDSAAGLEELRPSWERVMSFVLAELRRTPLADEAAKDGQTMPDAPDVAKALPGDAGVPSLRMLLLWNDEAAASALASVGTELALRVLAERCEERSVLPIFLGAALAHPDLAVDALAPSFGPPRAGEKRVRLPMTARATLLSVLAANPGLAKKAPALAAEAGVGAEIARPDELPPALATPPWRAPKPAKKAPAKAKGKAPKGDAPALAPIAHAERLDWGKRKPEDLYDLRIDDEPGTMKRARSEVEAGESFFLLYVNWLGEENAMALLREIPTDRWYGQEDDVEGILARFGLPALDLMLAFAKRKPDVSKAFLAVDSPRVAPHMAHLYVNNKKMKESAAKWLTTYPRAAAVGLIPAVAVSTGKAKAALEASLALVRAKHGAVVAEVVREYGAGAGALVSAAEEALGEKHQAVKEPKLAAFFDPKTLPRPLLRSGAALDVAAMTDLAKLACVSKLEDPHPALEAVRGACDGASLARFAYGVFLQWLREDGPSKHAWGLQILGYFGDAQVARALGPMAKAWAPGGLPQRAQAACDVLACMGHDAALLALHNLAGVRSKALARHAEQTLERVAKDRGMTRDEIADRLVPDLGLAEDGTLLFDFGARRFTLAFDADMRPVLIGPGGARLDELPKPAQGDDEELARGATDQWKELKKRARGVVGEQIRRLELAMTGRRRFSVEHFETFFSRHALMQHLARRLLWATYGAKGLEVPFRVAEDGSYAGAGDAELALDGGATVGVVHPLDLDAKARAAWGTVFGEYEIVQPFPQLGREIHEAKELAALAGAKAESKRVLGLRAAGWIEGPTGQGGVVQTYLRACAGQCAVLVLDPGVYLGDPSMEPVQTLAGVELARADEEGERGEALSAASADPVLVSEVVRDLARITRT